MIFIKRGFSGAILTDDRMHFTRHELKRNIVQCQNAREIAW